MGLLEQYNEYVETVHQYFDGMYPPPPQVSGPEHVLHVQLFSLGVMTGVLYALAYGKSAAGLVKHFRGISAVMDDGMTFTPWSIDALAARLSDLPVKVERDKMDVLTDIAAKHHQPVCTEGIVPTIRDGQVGWLPSEQPFDLAGGLKEHDE